MHFWPFDGWEIPAGRSAIAEVYPALWSRSFAREGRDGDQHDAYVRELQAQIQVLSERAANLAANLVAANEQNELHLARIDALQDELTKAKEPRGPKPGGTPG